MNVFGIILAVIAIVVGYGIGYYVRKNVHEKELDVAKNTAEGIISEAKRAAETHKKEKVLEAKEESHRYRAEVETELKQRRNEVQKQEDRLLQREETLDHKENTFEKREDALGKKEEKVANEQKRVEQQQQSAASLITQRQAELERVAALSQEQARDQILTQTREQLTHERAVLIKENTDEVKAQSEKEAKNLIVQAIQQSAADMVSETTVSVVSLPNDDMKGRIIGREGRNIRTLETLTGIDLIIDDTPEAVVLSGYDPIRREIAKIALEKLIQDGRIHPARIEEMVEKARKEVNDDIYEAGEGALMDLGIHKMHPELVKVLGRLKYRTSYGQNVLQHSIEVGRLSGVMAAELGLDEKMAVRAGLLHDIGKAIDHELDGSHVEIGVELAMKYHEPDVVVNTIASHHGDVAPLSFIAELVVAADALSSARPGARSESLENYVKRLQQLESIANSYRGVKQAYAIQAGREIRVMVEPSKISDDETVILARDIKNQVEAEMDYPGNIKVTVIREKRAVAIAK